jgi:hypothetical protein
VPCPKPISRRRKVDHYRVCSAPDRLSGCNFVGDRAQSSVATLFHAVESLVAWGACYALRRTALPVFAPGISGSWYFRAGKRAPYRDRANRSLPFQSKSHIFVIPIVTSSGFERAALINSASVR